MRDTESRKTITMVMWGALSAFMIVVVLNAPVITEEWMIMVLTLVPLMFGFVVTLSLWSPAVFPWIDAGRLRAIYSREDQDDAPTGKRKRQAAERPADGRLQLLLELMDTPEREQFKQDLKRRVLEEATIGEDGEIQYRGLSLSELIDDDTVSTRH